MDFTNINDPAGIKALLDQLRSSQAWQESITSQEVSIPETNSQKIYPTEPQAVASVTDTVASSSVASLLSQLQQAAPPTDSAISQGRSDLCPPTNENTPTLSDRAPQRPQLTRIRKDVRSYTLQQALPYLGTLSEDPDFIPSLTQMKQEQSDLERQLWDERLSIQNKYDNKVKVAQTKANMIGTVLSKHEATMLNDAFQKEITKFNIERVLPAWDGLVAKQQATLEGLSVPTMFTTDVKADRERQQRVMQILEGIVGGDSN